MIFKMAWRATVVGGAGVFGSGGGARSGVWGADRGAGGGFVRGSVKTTYVGLEKGRFSPLRFLSDRSNEP